MSLISYNGKCQSLFVGVLMEIVPLLLISTSCDAKCRRGPKESVLELSREIKDLGLETYWSHKRQYSVKPWGMRTSGSNHVEINPLVSLAHAGCSAWHRQAGKALQCYSQHQTSLISKGRAYIPSPYLVFFFIMPNYSD